MFLVLADRESTMKRVVPILINRGQTTFIFQLNRGQTTFIFHIKVFIKNKSDSVNNKRGPSPI